MKWPAAYLWIRRIYILGRFAIRRPHDPDFYAFARTQSSGLFLDVGANSGFSALSFRTQNRTMSILSIEANPFHEADLRFLRRWLRSFNYRIIAAGENAGSLRLHVPVYNGVPLTGEASVLELNDRDLDWWVEDHLGPGGATHFEFLTVDVPALPLDTLGLAPSIVKVDVEGFELSVLKGLRETLGRCRPLLMLESSSDMAAISSFLDPWDYLPRSYDRRSKQFVAIQPDSINVFYVPAHNSRTP